MTDLKIIELAIKKTAKNGMERFDFWSLECVKNKSYRIEYLKNKQGLAIIDNQPEGNNSHGWDTFINIEAIVFNHEFAKAFFGEKTYSKKTKPDSIYISDSHDMDSSIVNDEEFIKEYGIDKLKELQIKDSVGLPEGFSGVSFYWKSDIINKGWEYHLQQMVLFEDPLKYLENFL